MDARMEPLAMFGLGPGDAHVIRNAGGRVAADVIRSLVVSTLVLGVRTVAVVDRPRLPLRVRTGRLHPRA